MSSVIVDNIDCPQCGLPAQKDDYYVIGEERVVCNWCGYSHLKTIEGTESSKGYGSIHYVPKESNGSNQSEKIVRLKTPSDIIHRHKVIMDIEKNYDNDKSSFYTWNEEGKSLDCLIGNKPKTIDEEYQEQREKADYYRQLNFSNHSDDYTNF